LRGYDYSQLGACFITLCTKNRVHYFREIVSGQMVLNDIWIIGEGEWIRSFEIRKAWSCDRWVMMPDHIRGIVSVVHGDCAGPENGNVAGTHGGVETRDRASLQCERNPKSKSNPKSIS